MRFRAAGLAIVVAAVFCEDLLRPRGEMISARPPTAELGPRYCGAYALAVALKSLDLPADRQRLTSTQYVSETGGSTAADLCRGAEDSGAHARVLTGIGAAALRAADAPLILHVRQPGPGKNYSHWVLFWDAMAISRGSSIRLAKSKRHRWPNCLPCRMALPCASRATIGTISS